jgi:hypothetical protein
MELQDLLNDVGDINDDVTAYEIYLGLLHTEIKYRAIVPANPQFEALPRAYPIRPFKLCLPFGFQASPLAFFKLFFADNIFDILVRNTNLYAEAVTAPF